MRAMVYEAFGGTVEVRDVADPTPPADGVVVEVAASGLCRSDWHGWKGNDPTITVLPHVPGHELAGTVVEVGGEASGWWLGQRVTVPFVVACGDCGPCRTGDQQVCLDQWQPGFDGWGSHAQYVAIPRAEGNLVSVPHSLEMVTAAALGCRFTTAWRAVVERAEVRSGEWVAVHGCGGVGLSAIMVAASRGARVVAIDVATAAIDRARDVGAEVAVDASDHDDVAAAVRDLTGGGTAVSIDAFGSHQTCSSAIRGLATRGRHVQVGLLPRGAGVPMDVVIARELHVLGSHGIAAHRFADVLAEVGSGLLSPERLAGQRVHLDDAVDAVTGTWEGIRSGLAVIDTFEAR